jgi:hypothetical protein
MKQLYPGHSVDVNDHVYDVQPIQQWLDISAQTSTRLISRPACWLQYVKLRNIPPIPIIFFTPTNAKGGLSEDKEPKFFGDLGTQSDYSALPQILWCPLTELLDDLEGYIA